MTQICPACGFVDESEDAVAASVPHTSCPACGAAMLPDAEGLDFDLDEPLQDEFAAPGAFEEMDELSADPSDGLEMEIPAEPVPENLFKEIPASMTATDPGIIPISTASAGSQFGQSGGDKVKLPFDMAAPQKADKSAKRRGNPILNGIKLALGLLIGLSVLQLASWWILAWDPFKAAFMLPKQVAWLAPAKLTPEGIAALMRKPIDRPPSASDEEEEEEEEEIEEGMADSESPAVPADAAVDATADASSPEPDRTTAAEEIAPSESMAGTRDPNAMDPNAMGPNNVDPSVTEPNSNEADSGAGDNSADLASPAMNGPPGAEPDESDLGAMSSEPEPSDNLGTEDPLATSSTSEPSSPFGSTEGSPTASDADADLSDLAANTPDAVGGGQSDGAETLPAGPAETTRSPLEELPTEPNAADSLFGEPVADGETSSSGLSSVAPVSAPSFSRNDLAAANVRATEALDALATAQGTPSAKDDIKIKAREAYIALANLGKTAALVESEGSEETSAKSSEILGRIATNPNWYRMVGTSSVGWMKAGKGEGVVTAGEVVGAQETDRVWELQIQPPGKSETVSCLVPAAALAAADDVTTVGKPVVLWGWIVRDPSTDLSGYAGTATELIWTHHVIPGPATMVP